MATILVAEEASDVREHLRDLLGGCGYQVVTAADGLEALSALGAYELDVVLADLHIPGMDDTQVRAWKQLAPDTEVVVATMHDGIASALECVRGGAFDFVEKPFVMHTLIATIERAIERRQLRVASTLFETSRAILNAREPERLPEVIVNVAMKVMNADDVALLVPGHDGALYVACSTALTDSIRREVHASICPLLQQLAPTLRKPLLTRQGSIASCILYPLSSGDRLIGMLAISRVINARAFALTDVGRAAVLASQILLALENMRLVRHAIANERLASLGQLVSSIAHEVNNPIAYVLASHTHIREQLDHSIALCAKLEGGNEVVELRARLDEMRQPLEHVRDGAERVRDLLRDTRALVQNQDTPVSFDVSDSIRSALRVVAAELRHRATVTSTFGSNLFVHGRPGGFAQVLVNVLVHMAANLGDSTHNAITIASKLVGGHVIVTLRDNGPGIAPEALPRLFDPFVTNSLAFARDIVRGHGGELSVEGVLEGGTCYLIVLPLAAPARVRSRTDSPVVTGGARLRILLVDDEPNILRAYKRTLRGEHDLIFAADGAEALTAITAQADFDLVLCDVSMPTMSGMQLFEHVRKHVPALAERFVFATGGATQKSVEEFLAAIPNLVLEKPFEMRVLRQLVADLQRAS
jgi:CheY-like chemotaxis protein